MPDGLSIPEDRLWLPNVQRVELEPSRSWNEAYALRPFFALVIHIMQGYVSYIGTRGAGKPSAHFVASRQGPLIQNVPLSRVAKTNGGALNPSWELAGHVPWHYSTTLQKRIQDFNRPTVTFESEGFSNPPYDWRKLKPNGRPTLAYSYDYCYGPPGQPDEEGRPYQEWPPELLATQIECAQKLWDMGHMAADPSEQTIIGHVHINSRNRPNDPGAYWLNEHWPKLIEAVRGAPQGKLQPTAMLMDPFSYELMRSLPGAAAAPRATRPRPRRKLSNTEWLRREIKSGRRRATFDDAKKLGWISGRECGEFSRLLWWTLRRCKQSPLAPWKRGESLYQAVSRTIKNESNFDPKAVGFNEHGRLPGGKRGPSRDRGLAQINDVWHAYVTDAQAFNPRFALLFIVRAFLAGNEEWWHGYTRDRPELKLAA